MLIRFFDLLFSLLGLILGLPLIIILALLTWIDTGDPLFRQKRVGRHLQPFTLMKFQTMKRNSPAVATHLVNAAAITPLGRFLRKTKLDELPQLWNVLTGEMSLVGPRPCLFNQTELIFEREKRGIFEARPGITGLAQLKGIDMSTPLLLAETDLQMLMHLGLSDYFRFIGLTLSGQEAGRLKLHRLPAASRWP